ncbi:MAG TPA: hypothetical protein VLX91_13535 [Candidatus Acidoferrales bacterium]|nr:hypothetical protein [Candidatus Acidoferrales bacterium]
MESDTTKIVASNLTVAYCLTINRKSGPGTAATSTAEAELSKEKILEIYEEFLRHLTFSQ